MRTSTTTWWAEGWTRSVQRWTDGRVNVGAQQVFRIVYGTWVQTVRLTDPFRAGPTSPGSIAGSSGRVSVAVATTGGVGGCGLPGGTLASCAQDTFKVVDCAGRDATARLCLPVEPRPGPAGSVQATTGARPQGGDAGPARTTGAPVPEAPPLSAVGGRGGTGGPPKGAGAGECEPSN